MRNFPMELILSKQYSLKCLKFSIIMYCYDLNIHFFKVFTPVVSQHLILCFITTNAAAAAATKRFLNFHLE